MEKGKIIFLNGTSSSGKSTLAKKLQAILEEPYFHLCCDTFYEMASEKFRDDVFFDKAIPALNNSIKTFSLLGNNVIADHVLFFEKDFKECISLLYDHPLLFVGVHCPLEELERREAARGDRGIGMAKSQYEVVHSRSIYDIEVNTFESTIDECATKIKEKLIDIDKANAFVKLKEKNNIT